MKTKWLVIVNPVSGKGRLLKEMDRIGQLLKEAGIDFLFISTEGKGHAITLVEKAILAGIKNFIAVGGDGTLHEIINGVCGQETVSSREITVGMIPAGRGNDWCRTFGIRYDFRKAIAVIRNGNRFAHDVGRIDFTGTERPPRYFINMAGFGYDAFIVRKTTLERGGRKGGRLHYMYLILKYLFQYREQLVGISTGGEELEMMITSACAAICRYNGGGLKQAPFAVADDGLLDITIIGRMNKMKMITRFPRLLSGSFVKLKEVKTLRAAEIRVKSSSPDAFIEADGEYYGSLPVKLSVLPKAVNMMIHQADR